MNNLVPISWPDKPFLTKVVKCEILEITRFLIKAVLHGTICMIRFVELLFSLKPSSYKSEEKELLSEEIELLS